MPGREEPYCNSGGPSLLFHCDLSVAPWQLLGLSEVSLKVEALVTTLKSYFHPRCDYRQTFNKDSFQTGPPLSDPCSKNQSLVTPKECVIQQKHE